MMMIEKFVVECETKESQMSEPETATPAVVVAASAATTATDNNNNNNNNTEIRATVRELLRLRNQHRRALTLQGLYARRTANLRARVQVLEETIAPVSERIESLRRELRRQVLLAPTSEARRSASTELESLREQLLHASSSSALETYATTYDSDAEIREDPTPPTAAEVLINGKKTRRPRTLKKFIAKKNNGAATVAVVEEA
jgi:hypothetical protein